HLFTHAFFKALLFLGSGSVITAMHHEQDMRRMGGLRRAIPFTFWMMVIGTLALTGFPFTAGYYSKDAIIEAAYAASAQHPAAVYGFLMTVIAAGLTSFYSWRLIFMTFFGERRAPVSAGHEEPSAETDDAAAAHGMSHSARDKEARSAHVAGDQADAHDHSDHGHGDHEPHESPLVMLVPLGVLGLGALFAGLLFRGAFIGGGFEAFWKGALASGPGNQILEQMDQVPAVVSFMPTLMMIVGALIAIYMYLVAPDSPRQLAESNPLLYKFLLNKWYFDELYDFLFVRPAFWIGRLFWKGGDGRIIDGIGPNGVAARVVDITAQVVKLQTGYVYHYAFAMLIGVAALITWYLVGGVH
ncbi:MAG TPA: proton-conducting transporter membrane subunit, partial [Beijerinckiaceae bacterium]|nr:proton-conducting transporter membrane subunit [Beijerinckiaceae bacterium]